MTETLPIDTAKYDESRELDGLEGEDNFFVSPHHVPHRLVAQYNDTTDRITARFRYLTDQEDTTLSEFGKLWITFGSNSGRVISVEFEKALTWDDVAEILRTQRTAVNHYVAFTVLRDFWKVLLTWPT